MASTNKKLSGCYRRVLTFLLVVVAVSIIAGGVVYRRVGGPEGARYWMAERALNGVEKHLKSKNRPDGISEDQVIAVFANVREAAKERKVSLTSLYRVLKSYQTEFHTTKPSTPEVQTFLIELERTILKDTIKE
ncbi:hypothetical protein J4G07_09160 [Candidatus Poribacteria bacterium]|nr:hypothetical protein [Candidatus Poribacteria bacterium]